MITIHEEVLQEIWMKYGQKKKKKKIRQILGYGSCSLKRVREEKIIEKWWWHQPPNYEIFRNICCCVRKMQESNAQLLAINKSDEKNFFQVNFSRNKEKKNVIMNLIIELT